MAPKHICVIGCGASGLTSIKVCREEGFDVTCYDKTDFVGGLWKYRETDEDGLASVMKSTIINSSKEMSAYSDFPPPKELPNYMHNSSMLRYFEMYADQFDLKPHIHFQCEVIKLEPAADHNSTGRWTITVKDLKTSKVFTETYDGVMVCTGHHVKPLIPNFKGQEKFRGRIIHTHSYKTPIKFADDRVVVVGIGNSGGDAAVELSSISNKTYLSTRRGAWVVWRVGPGGKPFDGLYIRRFVFALFNYVPYWLVCSVCELYVNLRFNHKLYNIQPEHRIFSQHPMVNDALPNRILSGTVIVKPDIEQFHENGVQFSGENEITECESVILATGYLVSFPFIDQKIIWTEDNNVELYKYMFPPKMKHPHTLAMIGLIQAFGPAIPISEIQARWFVQLMKGTRRLPDEKTMLKDIEWKRKEMAARYFHGPRHTMQIDWVNYMDEIASQFGAKPNLLKLLIIDPRLFYNVIFGPCLPYQFRLNGPGSWPGAREAILTVNERINSAFQTRFPQEKSQPKSIISHLIGFAAHLTALISVLIFVRRYLLKNIDLNSPIVKKINQFIASSPILSSLVKIF